MYNLMGILVWSLNQKFKEHISITVQEDMWDGDKRPSPTVRKNNWMMNVFPLIVNDSDI